MFIKALRDTAHIFKAAKEPFDDISFVIKPCVMRDLLLIRSSAWNNSDRAIVFDCLTNGAAVIGFVSTDRQRRRFMAKKRRQDGRVMRLTTREYELQRSSASIDHGMELRRAASA